MGLKPPPRERVVATGRVTAVVGRWRGLAGRHTPVANETDDAVDVAEDRACQALVVEAQVADAGQAAPTRRWLQASSTCGHTQVWCGGAALCTRMRSLASPGRYHSHGTTSAGPLTNAFKEAWKSLSRPWVSVL